MKAPYLQLHHNYVRLNWIRRYLQCNSIHWTSSIFTDKKLLTLMAWLVLYATGMIYGPNRRDLVPYSKLFIR